MTTSIKVKQGTIVSLRYDEDGSLWVDGLEPVTPEPKSIAAVVRFRAGETEFCAFKVNNESGGNFRVTATTGEPGLRRYFRSSGYVAFTDWDTILKVAEDGVRVYEPAKRPEPSASSVGTVRIEPGAMSTSNIFG